MPQITDYSAELILAPETLTPASALSIYRASACNLTPESYAKSIHISGRVLDPALRRRSIEIKQG